MRASLPVAKQSSQSLVWSLIFDFLDSRRDASRAIERHPKSGNNAPAETTRYSHPASSIE
jgi:hypothetical protein